MRILEEFKLFLRHHCMHMDTHRTFAETYHLLYDAGAPDSPWHFPGIMEREPYTPTFFFRYLL